MSLERYIPGINKSVAFALLIIVIFSSCGISYNLHYCHNSLAAATLFPGLNQPVGCGCESSVIPGKSDQSNSFSGSIHKTGCCRNISFYNKIAPNSFNEFFQGHKVLSSISNLEIIPGFYEPSIGPVTKKTFTLIHHPPPLSGKLLVYSLHQLRIPSFSGDCCQVEMHFGFAG
jgi:hypothetical protein